MVPDLKALQSNVNITKELGFVKDNINVENYSDIWHFQKTLKARLNEVRKGAADPEEANRTAPRTS